MIKKSKKQKGFTLLEVLLSVAIIIIILGIASPIYQAVQNRNDLHLASMITAQTLRRAQLLSQTLHGDSTWGVHIQTGSIILFKGSDFASRDQNYDEVTDISQGLLLSGQLEYVFEKQSGNLLQPGSLNISTINNELKTITINEKGTIQY